MAGPVIANVATQFWTDVIWKDVDYVYRYAWGQETSHSPRFRYPLDGAVIVTSPQEIVSMVVEKALNMAGMWGSRARPRREHELYHLPDGKKIELFGRSHFTDRRETRPRYTRRNPDRARACRGGRRGQNREF